MTGIAPRLHQAVRNGCHRLAVERLRHHFARLHAACPVRALVGPEEDLAIGQALLRLADVAVERLDGLGLQFGRAGGESQQDCQCGPSHVSILTRGC